MNRPGEFGLTSDLPTRPEPKPVPTNPSPVASRSDRFSNDDGGRGSMSPIIKWSGVVVAVLAVVGAGWYFLLRDSGEDNAADTPNNATTTSAAPTSSTDPLPPKPTIAAGERLPVLNFDGTADSVVVVDPPGPRVATISFTGTGPFVVTGKDASGGDVATYVSAEGPYEGSVAVDFHDDQDSRSIAIEANGPWTMTMTPVEDLEAIASVFTGTGDDVVLYSGDIGPVQFVHSGTGDFKVNTFEIRTRDIETIVESNGEGEETVELRGPAFVWIEADGDWSATPQG